MNAKRRGSLWRHAAAAVLSMSLLAPAAASAASSVTVSIGHSPADRAKEVLETLEKLHVDAPDANALADTAIEAMVQSLKDPHTAYYNAKELEQFQKVMNQQYVGIGVRVSAETDGLYVKEVFDGPAYSAGIRVGDVIVQAGGKSLIGLALTDATSNILGEPGTEVQLIVVKQDGSGSVTLNVKRESIQVPIVTAKRFGDVGYIRVSSFSHDADEQTDVLLDHLKQQGPLSGFILDLRDNPGGLLDSAQQMARLFKKEGTLIHTKDRDGKDDPVTFQDGEEQPFPVYFLVNNMSASASEVLMGALQDYGVITAIGTKTYGKGSVQNLVSLDTGGALKVTIEEYLTPNMRKVNGVGLEPDLVVEGGEVPELLAALRKAGVKELSLELKRLNLYVNGFDVEDSFNVIRENGQTYVPTRVLAGVLGAAVSWNADTSSVQLKSADGSVTYTPQGDAIVLREGTSYTSAAKAAAAFRSLEWSDNGHTLKLSARSGG
ncbi:S41 family peptidase [Paenibacillus sp. YYML68]|uniref:S41 family peptidase n=1 Tax=Paenibacillus sp. YYML68 TaxID=2909250 RepID=UPI0024920081|nr:S41 family peptidase [Paenibacillus sp. YYML68]